MNYKIENIDTKIEITNGRTLSTKTNSVYFSIIIPSYEEEKIISNLAVIYTKELKSKYNFEVILSDGGSKDSTVHLAAGFADKIVVHQGNHRQTISEGRNRGAEVAEGEILVFINADTYPKDIHKFFDYLTNWRKDKNCRYNAIACAVHGFPEEINIRDTIFYWFHNRYVKLLNSLKLGMGRGECQIVRRKNFRQVNGYNPAIVAGEDFDLFFRLSKITKIKYEPELIVLESPRRFRKYGYLKTLWFWSLNSLSIIFAGKSYSKEWEAIR